MVHIIGTSKEKTYTKDQLLSDPKIQEISTIGDSVHFLKRQRPLIKIGVYVGRFPGINPKDAVFLSLCRTKCDMLIVLLESDYSVRLKQEKSLVEFSAKERAFTVASLPFVDWVSFYDEEMPDLALGYINPDYVFYGLYSDDNNGISDIFKDKMINVKHPFELDEKPKKVLPLRFFDIKTE